MFECENFSMGNFKLATFYHTHMHVVDLDKFKLTRECELKRIL